MGLDYRDYVDKIWNRFRNVYGSWKIVTIGCVITMLMKFQNASYDIYEKMLRDKRRNASTTHCIFLIRSRFWSILSFFSNALEKTWEPNASTRHKQIFVRSDYRWNICQAAVVYFKTTRSLEHQRRAKYEIMVHPALPSLRCTIKHRRSWKRRAKNFADSNGRNFEFLRSADKSCRPYFSTRERSPFWTWSRKSAIDRWCSVGRLVKFFRSWSIEFAHEKLAVTLISREVSSR